MTTKKDRTYARDWIERADDTGMEPVVVINEATGRQTLSYSLGDPLDGAPIAPQSAQECRSIADELICKGRTFRHNTLNVAN